jgi:hypothetical protein
MNDLYDNPMSLDVAANLLRKLPSNTKLAVTIQPYFDYDVDRKSEYTRLWTAYDALGFVEELLDPRDQIVSIHKLGKQVR